MNLSDTIELINALKAKGASHFKSHDFEISFNPSIGEANAAAASGDSGQVIPSPIEGPNDPIATKQVQDVIDILKSKDEEILNHVFPDGAI